MVTILSASIAILVNLALAALTNNTYNASHLFHGEIFGSQSERIYALKYGLASLFLSVSFLCSFMAVGFLIDSNLLINVVYVDDDDDDRFSSDPYSYTQTIFERGFGLALVGNRVLCVTFRMLLWMFGPLPVVLSSATLVWGLYEFDFESAK
ncbi:Lung seven transmembrane receptor family protein isoform 1 [Hibiscus syriacus]|uniref:Lung seven transmembrane receptor family protein isoform 1 n=1 Tax=Hibiscus syriacus TaxID=106335 RepID=A0A6A3C097_HIBSY|nr:Lung seven transmembrane receptor family protein isoform 1 [Hibiscus syriacus]